MNHLLYQRMPYHEAVAYCSGRGLMIMGVSLVIIFPLFIAGLFLFLGSPVFALFVMEGTCPSCKNDVIWMTNRSVVRCRHCKARYTLKD